MSKYENDNFYERKFVCFKADHAEQALSPTELIVLRVLLDKIEDKMNLMLIKYGN